MNGDFTHHGPSCHSSFRQITTLTKRFFWSSSETIPWDDDAEIRDWFSHQKQVTFHFWTVNRTAQMKVIQKQVNRLMLQHFRTYHFSFEEESCSKVSEHIYFPLFSVVKTEMPSGKHWSRTNTFLSTRSVFFQSNFSERWDSDTSDLCT